MAKERKSWTLEEEKVLRRCIEECATLTDAFRKASKKINRSEKAIEVHYYYSKKHVLTLYKKADTKTVTSGTVFSRILSFVKSLFI